MKERKKREQKPNLVRVSVKELIELLENDDAEVVVSRKWLESLAETEEVEEKVEFVEVAQTEEL